LPQPLTMYCTCASSLPVSSSSFVRHYDLISLPHNSQPLPPVYSAHDVETRFTVSLGPAMSIRLCTTYHWPCSRRSRPTQRLHLQVIGYKSDTVIFPNISTPVRTQYSSCAHSPPNYRCPCQPASLGYLLGREDR
jgi:hypothetical protein